MGEDSAPRSTEEGRAFVQERLAFFGKVGFILSFGAFGVVNLCLAVLVSRADARAWPLRPKSPLTLGMALVFLGGWLLCRRGHVHPRLVAHLRPAPEGARGAPARPVHARGEARRRRHGGGLPGPARDAAAPHRGEAPAPREGGGAQHPALRARGPAHRPAQPPQHGLDLRLRTDPRRSLLLRDGVPGRHRPGAAGQGVRAAAAGARRARAAPSGRSPRRSPRDRPHPPRHQARQHHPLPPRRGARRGEGGRLRPRQGHRRRIRRLCHRLQHDRRHPRYLSPEAITRPGGVDGRSDLYALGAVGYFLLAGRNVFTGATLVEVCGHHLHTPPEPPSAKLGQPLPPKLEALVQSCLEKDPARRPQTAHQLAEALRDCDVGERRRTGFAARYYRVGSWAIAHRWRVLAGSLLFLALGGVLMSRLKTQFFPKDLSYLFYVDVWLPEDAPLLATGRATAEAEQVIREVTDEYGREHAGRGGQPRPVVESLTSFVGGGGPRFWMSVTPEHQQINYAQILVEVRDKHDTQHLIGPLQRALDARVVGANVDVRQLETAPPSGAWPPGPATSSARIPAPRGSATTGARRASRCG